jgi:hypothetical protein
VNAIPLVGTVTLNELLSVPRALTRFPGEFAQIDWGRPN